MQRELIAIVVGGRVGKKTKKLNRNVESNQKIIEPLLTILELN